MTSLTAFPDMSPVPRVQVVVEPQDVLPGTSSATVRRWHQDRVEARSFLVRGAVERPTSSPIVAMDYEAPFHAEAVYEAVCYDSAGKYIGTSQLGAITLEYAGTVIQQPLNPRLAVEVERLSQMAGPIRRETPGELVYPEDEALPRLVGLGPRRGVSGFGVAVVTDTFEQADALQATLGSFDRRQPQVWLIRTPPPQRLPRVFFCAVPSLEEQEINVRFGGEQIHFYASVTEVPPPVPGFSPAVLRYSDVGAVYDSYSGVGAIYTLYSDIARDQSLVGAAG